jgi:hypothetical protein
MYTHNRMQYLKIKLQDPAAVSLGKSPQIDASVGPNFNLGALEKI